MNLTRYVVFAWVLGLLGCFGFAAQSSRLQQRGQVARKMPFKKIPAVPGRTYLCHNESFHRQLD